MSEFEGATLRLVRGVHGGVRQALEEFEAGSPSGAREVLLPLERRLLCLTEALERAAEVPPRPVPVRRVAAWPPRSSAPEIAEISEKPDGAVAPREEHDGS